MIDLSKKYKTRDGQEVMNLTSGFSGFGDWKVYGMVAGQRRHFKPDDGKHWFGGTNLDLIEVEEVDDGTIVVELPPEIASTLMFVLNKVGGCPKTSPRKHIVTLRNALVAQGVKACDARIVYSKGTIHFKCEEP